MEQEKCSKVYIVKLPNNMCGIGACVIDSPDKVNGAMLSFPSSRSLGRKKFIAWRGRKL